MLNNDTNDLRTLVLSDVDIIVEYVVTYFAQVDEISENLHIRELLMV